jgi:hypothetical protein
MRHVLFPCCGLCDRIPRPSQMRPIGLSYSPPNTLRFRSLGVDCDLRVPRVSRFDRARDMVSSVLSFGPGHSFGPISRPAVCGASASPDGAPSRFWLPHSGPPRKAAPCFGSGGHSLRGAPGYKGRTGESMYLNRLTLIGFIGADAEVRNKQQRITIRGVLGCDETVVEECPG